MITNSEIRNFMLMRGLRFNVAVASRVLCIEYENIFFMKKNVFKFEKDFMNELAIGTEVSFRRIPTSFLRKIIWKIENR